MNQGEKPGAVVRSVEDVSDYDPTQGVVRAKRVNVTLWDGTSTYVVIPLSDYSAERVADELHSIAQHHASVMAQAAPVPPNAPPHTLRRGQGYTQGDTYGTPAPAEGTDRNPWGS